MRSLPFRRAPAILCFALIALHLCCVVGCSAHAPAQSEGEALLRYISISPRMDRLDFGYAGLYMPGEELDEDYEPFDEDPETPTDTWRRIVHSVEGRLLLAELEEVSAMSITYHTPAPAQTRAGMYRSEMGWVRDATQLLQGASALATVEGDHERAAELLTASLRVRWHGIQSGSSIGFLLSLSDTNFDYVSAALHVEEVSQSALNELLEAIDPLAEENLALSHGALRSAVDDDRILIETAIDVLGDNYVGAMLAIGHVMEQYEAIERMMAAFIAPMNEAIEDSEGDLAFEPFEFDLDASGVFRPLLERITLATWRRDLDDFWDAKDRYTRVVETVWGEGPERVRQVAEDPSMHDPLVAGYSERFGSMLWRIKRNETDWRDQAVRFMNRVDAELASRY